MSVDYYLVCREKKVIMPAFSFVTMGGGWVPDARWFEKFIFASGGAPSMLLHEDSDLLPSCDEKEKEWQFINAWHPFSEKAY